MQFSNNHTNREVIAQKEHTWTSYIRTSELIASSNEYDKTFYHYASDEMGSITHIAQAGHILNKYEYDAWGEIVEQTETIHNRFKYTGEQLDPIIQQYYLRARYYNPVIARFTQEDTYRGDGLNLYAYCANNPVMYVDPSGNCCGDAKNGDRLITPVDYLNEALKQQGLLEVPNNLKHKWSDDLYKYEVRIHEANPNYSSYKTIFRVARKKIPQPNVEGTGLYYLGTDNNWYHTSELQEFNKDRTSNIKYNPIAAKITHIGIE